ncbi:MAG TPA: Crp/Fnr family transcriptional regulator [Anaerolineales bacterium]|nr:Crp/Fnr family transcriptional regulator [Anaerolineales bacterium]
MPRPKSPVRQEWVDPAVCSLEYRLKIIGRLPFFRHLSPQGINQINCLFEDRDVAAGQAIYFEGDPGKYMYLVATGKVKLIRHTSAGREVLLDILRSGEYFGNLTVVSGRVYTETAVAQTDCCILQISSPNFEKVLNQFPDVIMRVLQAVGQRLEASHEIIKQLSIYTADQRIAAALIRLMNKWGEQKEQGVLIQLPFSRQDLAAMTGTTIETVSRVMSHFSAEGLISTGRKWVAIKDVERLQNLVKEGAVN